MTLSAPRTDRRAMRIAVFLPNWVGDSVMASPALRALRRHFPNAQMIGVVRPAVAAVFEGTRWLDRTLILNPWGARSERWLSVAMKLRHYGCELAVLFPNSFHSGFVAWLGGCKRRVGYARYGRSLLLTDRLQPVRDAAGQLTPSPVIDAYNRLTEVVGCRWPGHRMELATTTEDERAADRVWQRARFIEDRETVVLNPGAAFGMAKQWPAASFAEVGRRLADARGAQVLVLCGPGEQPIARRIVELAHHQSVHSIADGPLSIGLSKACVRRCHLLISTDSGPRHFAAAFNRPVVTVFGPTHIAWTETYHARAIHLQKKVPCGPCQLRVCPLDHRCMNELGPDEVLLAAGDLLNRYGPSAVQYRAG